MGRRGIAELLTMKIRFSKLGSLSAGVLLVCGTLWAHHGSRISYDLNKTVTVTGNITQYAWANPHVYFTLDVKDEQGNVVNWGAETYAPVIMARSGWTRTSLKPGDKVTMTVYPSKVGAPRGFLEKIVFPDGVVTDLGNPTE
jgi:Family of unknown function (DUF6152)